MDRSATSADSVPPSTQQPTPLPKPKPIRASGNRVRSPPASVAAATKVIDQQPSAQPARSESRSRSPSWSEFWHIITPETSPPANTTTNTDQQPSAQPAAQPPPQASPADTAAANAAFVHEVSTFVNQFMGWHMPPSRLSSDEIDARLAALAPSSYSDTYSSSDTE